MRALLILAALLLASPAAAQTASCPAGQPPAGKPMDVTCFGAVMDGTTDDTAAVQAAIQAARRTGSGGGQVYIPAGVIRLGQVNVPGGTRISGAGANSTAIYAASASVEIFMVSDPTIIRDVSIERLGIYGAGGGRQTGGHFAYFQNCYNCHLSDFYFSGAYVGVSVVGWNTVNVVIERGRSDGAGAYHFEIAGGSDTFLSHLITSGNGQSQAWCGLHLVQSGGTWISDSDFTASGHGTCVQPGPGQSVNWTFASNTALGDSGSGYGLFLNPQGGTIQSFTATGSWTSANKLAGIASQCDGGGTIQAVTLTGHRAIENTLDGMTWTCGDGIRIVAPTVVGNSNPNGGGVAKRNSGIVFGPGLSHFSVIGGEFRQMFGNGAFQLYGVSVLPGASDYFTIRDNDTLGTAGIDDRSTGSHKTVTGNW